MGLHVNHRSGGDTWYSDVLASCREGNMSVCDWQYLHGLPTNECGSWLVRQNRSMCGNHHCANFKQSTKAARLEEPAKWFEEAREHECQFCVQERQRRHRVLPALKELESEDHSEAKTASSAVQDEHVAVPNHLQEALSSSRFKECLFLSRVVMSLLALMRCNDLVYLRKPHARNCCGYKPKITWTILTSPI